MTFAPRRAGYPPAGQYRGSIWEVVLGLTPGSTGGGADHLELRYQVGGRTYTFVGNARFGMYPTGRAATASSTRLTDRVEWALMGLSGRIFPPTHGVDRPLNLTGHGYQPRERHSARCGRSAPRVESPPWPG